MLKDTFTDKGLILGKYNTIGFCNEGNSSIGEIIHKKCVQQDIPIYDNFFCGLSLKFATFCRINSSKLAVSIIDKVNKRVIFSQTLDCSTLVDCEWLDLYFNPVEGVKEATLIVTPISANHGNAVSLLFNPAFTNSKIKIWNHTIRGSLLLKVHFKNTKYRLSVCCITYNQVKYIKDALDGFVSQKTDFNFQVLINDDASTDGTTQIIRDYAAKYPLIIKAYYNPVNKGAEESFISILSEAKTEYVALCEGDDYWSDTTKIQKQVDLLDSNLELSACFHPVTVKEESNSKKEFIFPNKETHPKLYKENKVELEELIKGNQIQTNSIVYRWNYTVQPIAEVFPKNTLPGDWYLHLLHAEKGPIAFIPKTMAVYRKHEAGIWYGGTDKVIKKYGIQHANFFKNINSHFKNKFSKLLIAAEKSLLSRHKSLNPNIKKISVIIPTFNHELYLEECIESILNQKGTYDIEIIVGDDKSTDGTREILKKFSQIKVILHEKNIGLLENLRICLSQCSGDYVAICEGDDYWSSSWRLQTMLDFMESNNDCSFCFNCLVMEAKGVYTTHPRQELLSDMVFLKPEDFVECNYPGNYSCCFYRKDILQDVLKNVKSSSDWIVNTTASTYGRVGFLKQKMSVWRVHDKGSWNGLSYSQKIKVINSMKKDIIEISIKKRKLI